MTTRKHLYVLLAALLVLPGCTYNVIPRSYSAESIEAWVVDEATGKPLEGVIVVAHWPLEVGGHRNWAGELKIMETVTNQGGYLQFPSWGPIYAERGYLTFRDPEILLFKDGYKYERLTNPFTMKINKASVRRSQWSGKKVALGKFVGNSTEYASHLSGLNVRLQFLYELKHCYWKHAPKMLSAMYSKYKFFSNNGINFGPRSIQELGNVCGASRHFMESTQ